MKYWVYLDGEVPGSYEPAELAATPGFSETSMVCPAQGGIAERNWQRAGQFSDLVEALHKSVRPQPPAAPEAPRQVALPDDFIPKEPNDILNDSSSRIFSHVTELMKELENRREERALIQSLQRQVGELKNELLAARERIRHLEDKTALIPGFEDREKRMQELLASARAQVKESEQNRTELDRQIAALRKDLEKASRGEAALSGKLQHQGQVNGELSRQLAHKELTLAKAFSVIRRLEDMLASMLPPGKVRPTEPLGEKVPQPDAVRARPTELLNDEVPPKDPPIPIKEPRSNVYEHPPQAARSPVSFTTDSGRPEAPMDLPPEGVVRPVPSPWRSRLGRISAMFRGQIP